MKTKIFILLIALVTLCKPAFTQSGYTPPSSGGGGGGSGTVTSVATSNGITGGTITSTGTISGVNAAADGSTKGVASFAATDFNSSSGNLTLDFVNAQAASASVNGFLSSADWSTFNAKAPTSSPTFTGTVTIPTPFTLGAVSVLPTGTELNFVDGVTSGIQAQIDTKAPTASPTFTGTVTVTGNTLTNPKKYVALLTQSSTNAPTAIVLENTLGTTVTWARSSEGIFTATAGAAVFTTDKTAIIMGTAFSDNTAAAGTLIFSSSLTSTTVVTILQNSNFSGGDIPIDGSGDTQMKNTAIQIIVYP